MSHLLPWPQKLILSINIWYWTTQNSYISLTSFSNSSVQDNNYIWKAVSSRKYSSLMPMESQAQSKCEVQKWRRRRISVAENKLCRLASCERECVSAPRPNLEWDCVGLRIHSHHHRINLMTLPANTQYRDSLVYFWNTWNALELKRFEFVASCMILLLNLEEIFPPSFWIRRSAWCVRWRLPIVIVSLCKAANQSTRTWGSVLQSFVLAIWFRTRILSSLC